MTRLDAAEYERGRTFLLDIAKDLLPADTPWRTEGNEWRANHAGGLSINIRTAEWHFWGSGEGGYSPVILIAKLRPSYCPEECIVWLQTYLKKNKGTGSCSLESDDDDETGAPSPASIARAQEVLATMRSVEGTPAEVYLRSRGIEPPYPDCIGYIDIDDARCGEGALVAVLTAHERSVGAQLSYLTPGGTKSLIRPQRQRFNLEKAPGAVFRLPASPEALAGVEYLTIAFGGPRDPVAGYITVEGIEDALTLKLLDPPCMVLGLPGIAALAHLDLPRKSRVVHFADGDEEGSQAAKALTTGFDALLLDGVAVRATRTPDGFDANRILQERGLDGLRELATQTYEPMMSFNGRIIRLSRISDPVAYAKERKAVSEIFKDAEREEDRVKISVKLIDEEVKKYRREHAVPADAASGPSADDDTKAGKAFRFADTVPHPEPVDGAALLAELIETIGRYVIMSRNQCIAVALWIIFIHLFDIAEVAAKLWIKSPLSECGKTRLMRVIRYLSPRPLIVSNATASSVFRVIEMHCPTLLLDEADTFIANNEELRGILDSGFDRDDAAVLRNVPGPDGTIEPRIFSTWCPQALAGIGHLQPTIARRCFKIELQRKRKDQVVARLTRRTAGPLLDLSQKIARWTADHRQAVAATVPQIPGGMSDRLDEGWEIPLAIAEVIGGEWPAQARHAALAISGKAGAEDDGIGTLLLADIRAAFAALKDDPKDRISSEALVTFLINLEDRPWAEIGRGDKPLTVNKLARLLKPFHITPGTVQIGAGKSAYDAKGYHFRQFKDAFERYISADPPDSDFSTVGTLESQDLCGFQPDFKPSEAPGSDGLKNPESPSVSAASNIPTVEKPKNGGVGEENIFEAASETTPDAAGIDGSTEPNGSLVFRKSRRSNPIDRGIRRSKRKDMIRDAVLAHARAHPEWSAKDISKVVPRTASVIQQILDAALRDSTPEGTV